MFDVTLTANFQHQSQLVDIDKVNSLILTISLGEIKEKMSK